MTGYDVVALGETMVQLTPDSGPLDEATSVLVGVGGAESNVACYLAGSGHPVAWLSAVGDDPFGRRILDELGGYGVDVSHVRVADDAPTGVYFKDPRPGSGTAVHYYRAGSAASRMTAEALRLDVLAETKVVHLSGITPALSEDCARLVPEVIAAAHAAGAIVSFDVNYRPGLWSVADAAPVLAGIAATADLVFVGRDEAETLWGTATADEARSMLPHGRLVVKDGDVGATSYGDDAAGVFVPAPVVEVVEPVGAGDAFAAGYLHGLILGLGEAERLAEGHRHAGAALRAVHDVAPVGSTVPARDSG